MWLKFFYFHLWKFLLLWDNWCLPIIAILTKSILRISFFVYVKLHLALIPFNCIYIISYIIAAINMSSIWPTYIFYLSIIVSSYQWKMPFLDIPWNFVPLKSSLTRWSAILFFWLPMMIVSDNLWYINFSKHCWRANFQ